MNGALTLGPGVGEAIRAHGAGTYPHECCGALLGRGGLVHQAWPLPNTTEEGPRRRVLVGPVHYRTSEAGASEQGLELLGFYHSHPEHPARPSQYDKFILAKVNADENQELSAQFGVRGIPAVKAVVKGKIVDEFSGALPESAVREWLDKLIPSPAEELRQQAQMKRGAGDDAGALQLLAQASGLDPNNEWVRVDAAEIMFVEGQLEEARRLLSSIRNEDVARDARTMQLTAQIKLAEMSAGGENEGTLSAAIEADAGNLDARLKLANLMIASGRYEEGMDQLIEIVHVANLLQARRGRNPHS